MAQIHVCILLLKLSPREFSEAGGSRRCHKEQLEKSQDSVRASLGNREAQRRLGRAVPRAKGLCVWR